MKLARPKLSANLTVASVDQMVDDGELESAYVHDEVATNCNIAALHLTDTLLENVQMTGGHFGRIVARDVIIRQSDLSSASLDNGMFVRVEFVNCRLVGTDFSYTSIHDVTFKDCKLDRGLFNKADLRRVAFIGCSLDTVDLSSATLHAVDL